MLTGVVAMAASEGPTLGVRDDDQTVWAWGDSTFGQLGDGTATRRRTLVRSR